jgi:transposase InsO family protein
MIQLQIYPCCSHLPGSPIFNYHAKFSKLKPPVHPSHERHNLTALQRRKLYLHECCAHEGFDNLNRRIREGRFPNVDPALASVPDPQCLTCNFSKAHRHSHKSNNGHISSDHKHPGDGVSSDGMEAATPGRPFTTRGQPSNTRFRYTSFWIDHMSSFVYVTFHASKAASELLKSKTEFESWAQQYNVNIKSIRADNRVYAAQSFQEACHKKQQKLSFCGVGAHWQNGIAERFIRSITERARTILLHAMHRWPEVIKEELWTFAVQHAVAFFTCFNKKGQTLLSPSFIHR